MRIDSILYRGFINKDLRVSYVYNYESAGQYPTIVQRGNGNLAINPSFGISISEGFDRQRIYIPANRYYPFAALLRKSVNLISDNLYDIFPNVNRMEFEVDSRVLERFKTEQALTTHGMTIVPEVWVDSTSTCYPGIRINTQKSGTVSIPFEDAIPIADMLNSFEPHSFGLSLLRILGKID